MAQKIVISKSSRIDVAPSSTITQLHYAAANGNDSMVTYLLNAGCNVDEQDKYGKTALMLAVEGSHETTVAALLKFHPNIYAKDKFDKSVLQRVFALSLTRKAIIEMVLNILRKECDDDSEKLARKLMAVECPLYWAVLLTDTKVTRILMENGCAVDVTDPYRPRTALHVALNIGDFANAKLLIEYGADVDALDSFGKIPLACLSFFDDSDEELEILQVLLDRSTKWKINDGCGYIQLRSILTYGKSKALEMLFRYQIDWCAEDKYHQTPLHYLTRNSILHDNPDIINYFRDKKIAVNSAIHYKGNILTLAATRGLTKLVKILLDKGANPNIQSVQGNTPLLDVLSTNGGEESTGKIVGLLLQYGADPQIINSHDYTIFDILQFQLDPDSPLNFQNSPLAKYIIGYLALTDFPVARLTTRMRDEIRSNECFQTEFEFCKLQLENLQQTTIVNTIRFFELLSISDKDLIIYARDHDFLKNFIKFDLSTLNPYYSDILQRKLQVVKFRKDTADIICEIMRIRYDSYPAVVDAIIDYVIP